MREDVGEASKSMSSSISLYSIEQAIHYYIKTVTREVSSSGWRQFNWIWEELPWYAKLMGITGCLSFKSAREKYILPLIFKASIPLLERFQKGDWRRQEEDKLKVIFIFFHERMALLASHMPSEVIKEFLALSISSHAFPSFIGERDAWKEVFSTLSSSSQLKAKAILLWHRHETLGQYRQRLKSFYEGAQDCRGEKKASQPGVDSALLDSARRQLIQEVVGIKDVKQQQLSVELSQIIETIDAKLQEIKKRVEKIVHKLLSFRDKVKNKYIFRAILARHENSELYSFSEKMYQDSLSLLLKLEEIQEKLVELISRRIDSVERGKELFVCLGEIDGCLDLFEKRRDELEIEGNIVEGHLSSINSRLEGDIFKLFKRIDAIPLLSLNNPIRQQQMKLIKMAREKLKLYRSVAFKPPGPHISFNLFERELNAVIELAKSFYVEGKEIEEMKGKLKIISSEIEKIIQEDESIDRKSNDSIHSLENILTKISLLDKNIEILADRREQFERIVEELSQFERRREKKIS